MDTKSSNTSYRLQYHVVFKLLAGLLCMVGVLALAWGLLCGLRGGSQYAFDAAGYPDSSAFTQRMGNYYQDVYTLVYEYGSREAVAAGESLNAWEVENAKTQLEHDRERALDQVREDYYNHTGDEDSDARIAAREQARQAVEEEYRVKLAAVEQTLIARQLEDYDSRLEGIAAYTGFFYAVTGPDSAVKYTNIAAQDALSWLSARQAVFTVPANRWADRQAAFDPAAPARAAYSAANPEQGDTFYLAMDDATFEDAAGRYAFARNNAHNSLVLLTTGGAALLLGLLWLFYAAGRRPRREGVTLLPTDRVFLDVQFVLCFILVLIGGALVNGIYQRQWGYYGLYHNAQPDFANLSAWLPIALLLALMTALVLVFLTSVVKHLKARSALRHTLVFAVLAFFWRVLCRLGRMAGKMLSAQPAGRRAMLMTLGYSAALGLMLLIFCALLFTHNPVGMLGALVFFLGCLAMTAAAVYFIYRKSEAFSAIVAGAARMQSGDVSHPLREDGGGELTKLAGHLNNLAGGLQRAVNEQVKAERMKTELITNVSHDLKTPLTAIITYIGLLRKEGLACADAPHYVDVLEQRAQRLQSLTEDLFEAAKATSGTLPVETEPVDVGALLSQGLGELSSRIEASALEFRYAPPEEPVRVLADGRLLWRVFDNLLSNVFKYSLPGSRVYIDIATGKGQAEVSVKNISAQALNMPAEALMERFTRGDAARAGEGSGLGLSIARSLMDLQGGSLALMIDGDLFKATVRLRLAPA